MIFLFKDFIIFLTISEVIVEILSIFSILRSRFFSILYGFDERLSCTSIGAIIINIE